MKMQIGTDVREMTPDELANYTQLLADMETDKIKQLERQQARESALAKLADLGLTEAEIKALVG
jgi:hypothetical protein